MIWWVSSALLVVWFLLRFVIGKHGWVHLLLLAGVTFLIVQIAAYRKTKYESRMKRE
jgi:hypothetical protein